jgi:hypothetical protein
MKEYSGIVYSSVGTLMVLDYVVRNTRLSGQCALMGV